MKRWKTMVGISLALGLGVTALPLLHRQPAPRGLVNGAKIGSTQNGRSPASVAAAKAPLSNARSSTRSSSSGPSQGPFYKSYFTRLLLENHSVSSLYHEVSDKLPPGESSDIISVYIAEGIARNGSPEFSRFMTSLSSAISTDSDSIAREIRGNLAVFRSDPFAYQMMLNLAATLNVGTEVKAGILGDALHTRFHADQAGHISLMSANIANALILMKNSGVTSKQAMPYIQSGLELNQNNPAALHAYIARVNTYFPGTAGN